MKKLSYLFAAVMTALTVALFGGCGTDEIKNLSERRSSFFTGGAEGISVTVVSGVRESPYVSDGKAGALIPYTLITLVPREFDIDAVYTYSAEVGSHEFGGGFTVHPFAASFSAEFEFETTSDFTAVISQGDKTYNIELVSAIPDGAISYSRAVEAARTEIKPSGEYEVRARLLSNPLGGEGLCWHVAFITANGQTGVLLDPVTAKVLAKKT